MPTRRWEIRCRAILAASRTVQVPSSSCLPYQDNCGGSVASSWRRSNAQGGCCSDHTCIVNSAEAFVTRTLHSRHGDVEG